MLTSDNSELALLSHPRPGRQAGRKEGGLASWAAEKKQISPIFRSLFLLSFSSLFTFSLPWSKNGCWLRKPHTLCGELEDKGVRPWKKLTAKLVRSLSRSLLEYLTAKFGWLGFFCHSSRFRHFSGHADSGKGICRIEHNIGKYPEKGNKQILTAIRTTKLMAENCRNWQSKQLFVFLRDSHYQLRLCSAICAQSLRESISVGCLSGRGV